MALTGWIDSHCHLDDPRLNAERAGMVQRARQAGAAGWLVAGVDREQYARAVVVAQAFPETALAAGVHPWVVARSTPAQLERSLAWLDRACRSPLVVALGETGLDRLHASTAGAWERQRQSLHEHLRLARLHSLPVVLHVVRAQAAVLAALKHHGRGVRGVVHGFEGSPGGAAQYLRKGLWLGFGPGVLRSPAALAAATACPLERLLLETDAPERPIPALAGAGQGAPALLRGVLRAGAAARVYRRGGWAGARAANAARLFRRASWGAGGRVRRQDTQ